MIPLYAGERKAAALLDMPKTEFRRLVQSGALPPPRHIGGHERWSVDELRAIIEGKASLPDGGLEI